MLDPFDNIYDGIYDRPNTVLNFIRGLKPLFFLQQNEPAGSTTLLNYGSSALPATLTPVGSTDLGYTLLDLPAILIDGIGSIVSCNIGSLIQNKNNFTFSLFCSFISNGQSDAGWLIAHATTVRQLRLTSLMRFIGILDTTLVDASSVCSINLPLLTPVMLSLVSNNLLNRLYINGVEFAYTTFTQGTGVITPSINAVTLYNTPSLIFTSQGLFSYPFILPYAANPSKLRKLALLAGLT